MVWEDGGGNPASYPMRMPTRCATWTVYSRCDDPARLQWDDRYRKGAPRSWCCALVISRFASPHSNTGPYGKRRLAQYRLRGKSPDASDAVALIEHPGGLGAGFLASPNLLVTEAGQDALFRFKLPASQSSRRSPVSGATLFAVAGPGRTDG